MKPVVFIINLFFWYSTGFAQPSFSTDSLLNYEYAYYNTTSDSIKQEFLLKKFNYYLHYDSLGKSTFTESKRIESIYLKKPDRLSFLWNAALVAYVNKETNYTINFISEYSRLYADTSVQFHLLSALANSYSDSAAFFSHFNQLIKTDSVFQRLQLLQLSLPVKKRSPYLLASSIIPGSGTMAQGKILKGVTSLALNTLSVFGIIKLVQVGLYANAFLWGTGLGVKFYVGNIRLTNRIFENRLQEKEMAVHKNIEHHIEFLLHKYPILLKKESF